MFISGHHVPECLSSSGAITGHQGPSEVIRGHQRSSDVISGHHVPERLSSLELALLEEGDHLAPTALRPLRSSCGECSGRRFGHRLELPRASVGEPSVGADRPTLDEVTEGARGARFEPEEEAFFLRSHLMRQAIGWQSDGNQMAIGWQSDGNRMAIGWQSDGNRMAIRRHSPSHAAP